MDSVEAEVVRAQTRLDGVDARLKKIESKLDNLIWVVAPLIGLADLFGPQLLK